METKLERIKEVAYTYLKFDYTDTDIPYIISHPFTDTSLYELSSGDFIDIKEWHNWEFFIKDKKMDIMEADLAELIGMMSESYLLSFLWDISAYVSQKDLSEILRDAWQFSEAPNQDENVANEEAIQLFKKADMQYLMDKSEIKKIKDLSTYVTIYRGVSSHNKSNQTALSWTLDKSQAIWFAQQFGQKGELWSLRINKKDILAFFEGEDEVVINSIKYQDKISVKKL